MQNKFQKVRKVYDNFHRHMLSQGRLMVKDTDIGYWGISPTRELFELFQKTKLDKHNKFIDLGSGDGRAVLVADLFTNATGIEYDKELHGFAVEFGKKLNSRAKFLNMDFMKHNLSAYDYIFIHPDNHISRSLEEKLMSEMNPSSKLIVFGPHKHPESMQKVETIDIQGSLISVFKK